MKMGFFLALNVLLKHHSVNPLGALGHIRPFFWRHKLDPRDAGARLGLAITRHWSNCLGCAVLAATALVSGGQS